MASTTRPHSLPPVAIAGLLYFAVLSLLFFGVITGRETVIHGDALSLSLPFQQLLANAIAEGSFPLWSSQVYAGHPVFAEGQGGFAHPLNLLMFGLLPLLVQGPEAPQSVAASTLYAHGVYHLVCGWIAALGTFGLARTLGLGVRASLVAGLALACSHGWLGLSLNATIAGSTAWAPLVLLCVERWWREPSVARALELSGAATLMLLAGYPQALHATAIFALCSLALHIDRGWLRSPWPHLVTGLLALVYAAALSAVQLFPTLELIGESVRAAGVALYHSDEFVYQLRGLLVSIGGQRHVVPGLGSALLFALALLALRPSRKIMALLLPTLLLFQLGLGDNSPVYRALHQILPGLDSFRIASMYPTIGLVGVALLAGFGAERLARMAASNRMAWAGLFGSGLFVALAAGATHIEATSAWNYGIPLFALLAAAALIAVGRSAHVKNLVLALVVIEIFALRLPLHDFADLDVVRQSPGTVEFLLDQDPEPRNFKIVNFPHTHTAVTYATPDASNLPRLARRFLFSLGGSSNLLWRIPSVNANLALPLARRSAATPLIEADARGESSRAPGRRFIDSIGLRYLVFDRNQRGEPHGGDFSEIFSEDDFGFAIRENPHSQPMFRVFAASEAKWVANYHEAIAEWQRPKGAVLVLEGSPPEGFGSGDSRPGSTHRGSIGRAIATTNSYTIDVQTREPSFLFIADAHYPGWTARVSGVPSRVFAANVLGKAVAIPGGIHTVEIRFEPRSFRLGAIVSLSALIAAIAMRFALRRTPP